jgi:hypothetical protein
MDKVQLSLTTYFFAATSFPAMIASIIPGRMATESQYPSPIKLLEASD